MRAPSKKLKKEYIISLHNTAVRLIEQLRRHALVHAKHRCSNGNPVWLFNDPRSRTQESLKAAFRKELIELSADLNSDRPVTPHRLRYTYATSMLNAGMSLIGVMKLLGHNDYRMTLRYAELAPRELQNQYQSILPNIQKQYNLKIPIQENDPFNPHQSIAELLRWLKNTDDHQGRGKVRLIKRLTRLKNDLTL